MKLRWTIRARRDLLAIGRYIARHDTGAARQWVERLRAQGRAAARRPLAGRRVPELRRNDIREMLLRNYRVVYRVHKGAVHILTVFEGHRRLVTADVQDVDD